MKRILVAVDGSEPSLKAARMAADVALRFGSKLTLCHVVPKLLLPPDVYGLTIAEVEKEHRAYADRLLETAVASLDEPGLDVSTTVLYGSPAEAIAEEGAAADVGMVVIGSRGHGAVARVFLGSVSDRLVHISPKPVLVVHQAEGSMISVSDFMTKDLVTVREADDLALADSLLRLGGIRHLPVVRDRKLVGILTQRDVLRCGIAGKPLARELPVSEVMTREPTSVRPGLGLAHAARIMLERKFGCLPVCDDDGTLVGIVTEADFVRFAADVVRDLDLVAEAVRAQERTGEA